MAIHHHKTFLPETGFSLAGTVKWRSASNIALVKYWGKKGNQIPANPSLSFTLENSHSETAISFSPRLEDAAKIDFYFEGKQNPAFAAKIEKYLGSLKGQLSFLEDVDLVIESRNSFPHSAGIASSASGMSALALCLCSLEQNFLGSLTDEKEFFQKASSLARLGSGSAARSVYGGFTVWGENPTVTGSSDEIAIPLPTEIHPFFEDFNDTILIVSKGEKSVSSRQGHELMNRHPFAEKRYEQAHQNLSKLTLAIKEGNLSAFCEIVENEAFTLHALMMSSNPPVVLFLPATWEIINRVKSYRERTGHPVCITLDAGPNVHLLYPQRISSAVNQLINQELVVYCEQDLVIYDRMGKGPIKLN